MIITRKRNFITVTGISIIFLLSSHILTASETYHYDAQGRLIEITYGDSLSIFYTYDANSNILSILTARDTVTSSDKYGSENLIDDYEIAQNYPNPFDHRTTIPFKLPVSSEVKLTVFNNSGQVVCRLIDRTLAPGRYSVEWNGMDLNGLKSPPGVYFYQIETPAFSKTNRMILMR